MICIKIMLLQRKYMKAQSKLVASNNKAQQFAEAMKQQIAEDKAIAAIGNNNSLLGTNKKGSISSQF